MNWYIGPSFIGPNASIICISKKILLFLLKRFSHRVCEIEWIVHPSMFVWPWTPTVWCYGKHSKESRPSQCCAGVHFLPRVVHSDVDACCIRTAILLFNMKEKNTHFELTLQTLQCIVLSDHTIRFLNAILTYKINLLTYLWKQWYIFF